MLIMIILLTNCLCNNRNLMISFTFLYTTIKSTSIQFQRIEGETNVTMHNNTAKKNTVTEDYHETNGEYSINTWKNVMIKNNQSLTLLDISLFDEFPAQSTLKAIILIENEITLISEETFIGKLFEDVILLDVSRNKIQILKSRSLKGLASLRNLSLSHNNLTNIETNAFGHTLKLVELHFDHNHLTNLPDQLFKRLDYLNKLDAGYNQFLEVCDAFALAKAKHLSLESNRLVYMTAGISIRPLNYLNLKNNQLLRIDEFVFDRISGLEYLSLERNQLRRLQPGTLVPLDRLLRLSLANNRLATIPDHLFRSNNRLRFLYLQNNVLRRIGNYTFNGVSRALQLLDLRGNRIEFIAGSAFLGCYALRYLRLENNRLRHIGERAFGVFTGVASIGFDGNPVVCDCGLSWLRYRNEAFVRAIVVVRASETNAAGRLRCERNGNETTIDEALRTMSCGKGTRHRSN